jgi:hypothetical protein
MITFGIRQPVVSHYRRATCEEFGCLHYSLGWITMVPADSMQAHYIEKNSGRSFKKEIIGPNQVRYTFPPGQNCFASDTHRVPLERPAIFGMRAGDWRGNPTGYVRTLSAQSWVDAFGENMELVKEFHERRG